VRFTRVVFVHFADDDADATTCTSNCACVYVLPKRGSKDGDGYRTA
jgi:hypothetical protein